MIFVGIVMNLFFLMGFYIGRGIYLEFKYVIEVNDMIDEEVIFIWVGCVIIFYWVLVYMGCLLVSLLFNKIVD